MIQHATHVFFCTCELCDDLQSAETRKFYTGQTEHEALMEIHEKLCWFSHDRKRYLCALHNTSENRDKFEQPVTGEKES